MSMCTKIPNSQKYKDTQCACTCMKISNEHVYKDTQLTKVQRYPLCMSTKIPMCTKIPNSMFAWQDEVPTFEYVSIEDNAVAVQDLDAGFWESIANVPAYTVQDVEAAQ